ncbi:zinc protease [Granulicella aggregans]|uniref:Zinc protease n=1 Tax=Granulicella aggregans TaxID=474949 RepID=A0A7W7ZDH8_9BACT|nr:pitrilysin family protein [Granulicella aggregans]MBB5057599.1 zinc protease [Granulicella aggregans]
MNLFSRTSQALSKTVISTEQSEWRDPSISPVAPPTSGAPSMARLWPWVGLATAFLVASTTQAQSPEPWKQIPVPPLHAFKPAEPTRIELPNGLVIFLQEDHELPFISGTILIRGGSRDEPAAKTGLVSLYGQTWRTSGTATADGDILDDRLEAKAATIETGGGVALTTMSWSSLKSDFDSVFTTTVDLLLHPAFKADKLQLAKSQMEAGIARRNDDASGIAAREASLLVYGPKSSYGREAQYATVDAVTLADFKSWHDATVVPNNIILAVSGDFDPAAMEAKLRSTFGSLARGKATPKFKADFTGPKPGVYVVDKKDVNQSNVAILGLGTERNNPDYYALSVMNEIFSGGFGSRLFQDVRTKLGLAYQVSGAYGSSYDHPGVFEVTASTKSASTVAATQAMLDEIGKLKTVPPTPDELRKAKEEQLNSFIFRYDSPDKTLNEQVTLAFFGYPKDFLEKYKTGIESVTAADVSRVANKYIDASKLAILVVGNQSEMTTPVSTLGKVTTLDITIPGTPPGGPPQQ